MDTTASQQILQQLGASPNVGFDLRQEAMILLDGLEGFDWCGVYRLEGDELVLDAFVGEATDHTHIPVGLGVCGAAVAENCNQVIADVRELSNYLSCSVSTRSEIVVLIRDQTGKILGQIDIDGHQVGTFGEPEEELLSAMAEILASQWA
jgi:GAF domain-containing protein